MNVALRLWVMLVVLALGIFAQESEKPDYSGTWQLDLDRTRFGEISQPKSLVIQIEHREPQLRIQMVTATGKGEVRETLELTTDGEQHAQTGRERPCTATARWDQWSGARLVVEDDCSGNPRSQRFTLISKGKILTTLLTVMDGSVEKKAYEFFLKQGS